MKFKVTTPIRLPILALAPLLSTVLTVSAQSIKGTIAFYTDGNCGKESARSIAIGCRDFSASSCCSVPKSSNSWMSFTVLHNDGYLNSPAGNFLGYSKVSCEGLLSIGAGGTCVKGAGPYFSAEWITPGGQNGVSSAEMKRETNITTSVFEARDAAAPCATADVYGFIENGRAVTFSIPQGSKEAEAAFYKLLADEATDGAALRKFAGAHKLEEVAVQIL